MGPHALVDDIFTAMSGEFSIADPVFHQIGNSCPFPSYPLSWGVVGYVIANWEK
jgi:hypothetical protein